MGKTRTLMAHGAESASAGRPLQRTVPPAPWLIAIAGSTGGVAALIELLGALPSDLPAAVVLIQHRPPRDGLVDVLRSKARLPLHVAVQGERIVPGHVYLARADSHLTVTPDRHFIYRDGSRIRFVRSSANPLLESAARAFDHRCIAVVLTGGGTDATDGVQTVKTHGGIVIAQDQLTSEAWSMPQSAIRTGAVDYILPLDAIAPALDDIVHGRPLSHRSPQPAD